MARTSKLDIQKSQRELQDETDSTLEESEDIQSDAADASAEWSRQSDPSLVETADALNVIADDLRSDIRNQHDSQADVVDGAVERQRDEVSDPAREDERAEHAAAEEMNDAASDKERFGHILREAADARGEAEAFHREIAEEDERDQAESADTLDVHRREVEEAIRNIENL